MDMDEWVEPSPMELERMRVKRERSNKISKIMGQYLLKGYRMLGSTCNKCQAILVQDRQGVDYCIGCSEVDAPEQDEVSLNSCPSSQTSSTTDFATNTPKFDNQDQNTQAGQALSASHSRHTQAKPLTQSVSSFINGPDRIDFQQQQQQLTISQQQQTLRQPNPLNVPDDVLSESRNNVLTVVRRLNAEMTADLAHVTREQIEMLERCYNALHSMQRICISQ